MNETPSNSLTAAELQRFLSQVDSAVLLVSPRILRRVIKRDRGLTGLGLQVPHRKSYLIDQERLWALADADELGIDPGRELPHRLILLPLPHRQRLARDGRAATLLRFWRLLFHIRIHAALHCRAGDELLSRICRIGRTEFDEATAVLSQERFLLPPGDTATIYEEFAAVYLELRYFAPPLLSVYFPACLDREKVEAVWAEDVDAEALFLATCPEGGASGEPAANPAGIGSPYPAANPSGSPDAPRAYRRLLHRADKASARGNLVRAAIFRTRAVALAPSGQVGPNRAAAFREMEQFGHRLQKALGYPDEVSDDWRRALFALMEPASRGIWPNESRMLYDLQKVCTDRERPVYAVDLIEWLITWGRRPMKRLLPFHDSVRAVKHLRSALHRLTAVRIEEPIRRRLLELLLDSTHRGEHHLRERLYPVLRDALDKVGLRPRNIAEEVARDKVIEELIDRVVEHGFINIGDLRDILARNRLKLPDLPDADSVKEGEADEGKDDSGSPSSPPRLPFFRKVLSGVKTFLFGDELLRANRRLAVELDGVYRRGEIYLRWLQRLSAAAFGTQLGRWLTLYVALPFGCSLALLKVWDEVEDLLHGSPPEGSDEAVEAAKRLDPVAFALIGLFFLALFHIAPFRRFLQEASGKLWRALRWLFAEMPSRFLHHPWVTRLLQSGPWLFCYQFVLKPLPWGMLSALILLYLRVPLSLSLGVGAGVFALGSFTLNSRLGFYLEEMGTDYLARTWQLVRADLVPGFVRWLIYLYRRLQEHVERFIYTVDEWLRFRPGDNKVSLYAKPVLGSMWFVIAYGFRGMFNLFVEPTFNPIKHFPVVTVTAKLIVPIIPSLAAAITSQLDPLLGKAVAATVAAAVIFFIPGLAGFLVWELKENWRLYRANQPATLRPEIVGHHGETMLRLMRPGLHSGTLPKLFARLRHGKDRSQRKQYEALHHLRERLRHFVERNLFAVLARSKSWGDAVPLRVGDIRIATNRIRIELASNSASIHVDFTEREATLLAELTRPDGDAGTWLTHLPSEPSVVFHDALDGLFQMAGLEDASPILWSDWVRRWQKDAEGEGHQPMVSDGGTQERIDR